MRITKVGDGTVEFLFYTDDLMLLSELAMNAEIKDKPPYTKQSLAYTLGLLFTMAAFLPMVAGQKEKLDEINGILRKVV